MLEVPKKIIILPLKILTGLRNRKRTNMRYLKRFAVVIAMIFITISGSSQTLELGLFGGGSYYLGDMNTAMHFSQTQFSYGLLARFNVNSRWAIKMGYNRGTVKSDDSKNATIANQGLNFQSTINDITVVGEFNFLEYFTGSKRNYVTPYIFGGIGVFTFNPKSYDGVALQPLGTEGQNENFDDRNPYSKIGISIPFGIGIKYSLSERFALGIEWGMRKTFTDYIDDVSKSYYIPIENLDPNNIAHVKSDPSLNHDSYMQRGDNTKMDWFNFFGVSITYKINLKSRLKCNLDGW